MKQIILFLIIVAPSAFVSAQDQDFQTINVKFYANKAHQQWLAKAYEKSCEKFIGGFAKLKVMANSKNGATDYTWLGELQENTIRYSIVENKTKATINSGSIEVADDLARVQLAALSAVKPLVRNGGLVDQFISKQNMVLPELPKQLSQALQIKYPDSVMSLISLLGGMVWGYILLVSLSFVFGTLHGLERIWHWNLKQYILSWLEVSVSKFILMALLFAPAVFLGRYLEHMGSINFYLIWYCIVPVLLLMEYLLIVFTSLLVCVLLDKKYIKGKIKKNKAWDREIRRYFMGYYKRMGLNIPLSILDNILFLPGRQTGVKTYGGGLNRSRIVIPEELLILAIGEPDEVPFDDKDEVPDAANEPLGRIFPRKWEKGIKKKPNEKNIDRALDKAIFAETTRQFLQEPGGGGGVPLEASAGVWGHIRPNPDKSVGLISDNLQDLQVVKELLQEHHVMFAKLQFEEEYDDTDPSDYDFLFGLMLREIGKVHRREPLFLTLWNGFQFFVKTWPHKLKVIYQKLYDAYFDHLSKHLAIIDDGYVVLHHGRHHLAQFMFFQLKYDHSILSTRASHQNLFLMSSQIFSKFKGIKPEPSDLKRNKATLKNRLLWLSRYFSFALPDYDYKKSRPVLSILLSLMVLTTLTIEVVSSVAYAPVYEKRKQDVQQQIAEYEKAKENKDGSGK